MKSGISLKRHNKSNILQIKVNKRTSNTNTKHNSPSINSPHQENNYYYNTKINRLILQEAPNNNRIQNIYQPPDPSNKNILFEYDFLPNNINNIISEKNQINSLNKKNTNFQKLPITVNFQKKINEFEINNFYNKDNVFKDINGFNYMNINRNINNNYSQNISSRGFYEISDKNMNNFYRKNSTDEININSYKAKNYKDIQNSAIFNIRNRSNNYFNNVEDNNMNNKSNTNYNNNLIQRNFIINNTNNINSYNYKGSNCKKIPIKNEKVGNYYIKSPGMPDPDRLNESNEKRKIMSKNRHKSPEIILAKYKKKRYNFSNNKNNNEENPNEYKSGVGFYKKKDEINKNSSINNSNNVIHKNKTIDNISLRRNIIKGNSNNISNFNIFDNNSNYTNNLIIENSKILNPSNDIYLKVKPQNYKYKEITKSKSKSIESISNTNIKNINPIETKLKKINNFKQYIRNKLIDYNSMKKNIEDFCEILEQFFYISFKKSYNYFIKKLVSFNKRKNSNRTIILRRFKEGKKHKLNKIKVNNSMININNKDIIITQNDKMRTIENEEGNRKEIKIIENEEKKDINIENNKINKNYKSTVKFAELESNLINSMMKINQDDYIKIFNEIFNTQRIENKKCHSPLVNKSNIQINNYSPKNHFDNENDRDKKYDKYNTNTNVNIFFHKKNNFTKKFNDLKINTDLINHNNDSVKKKSVRTSLNSNDKIHSQNTSIKGDRKIIFKMKKLIDNNNINSIENNNINSIENNNKFYSNYFNNNENFKKITKNLDNKYFDERNAQNQKHKINNLLEPFIIDNRIDSEKKFYKKINNLKNNINNINLDKNNILYSKPLLKKYPTKYIEKESNYKNNNISDLTPKRNERTYQAINSCLSNNFVNRSLNSLKNHFGNELRKFVVDPEKKYLEDMNEIIVKNVGTEDKRLHVFIKYVNLENFGKKNRERLLSKLLNMDNRVNYNHFFDQSQFINKHVDSINLIINNKYKNKYNNFKRENILDEENYNILKINNNINIKDNNRYIDEDENENKKKIKERKNMDKSKLNKNMNYNSNQLLASIDREEKKSKNQISKINNSNNSGEEIINNYISEEVKNSTKYLISLLQNRYDDNKKSILYNFFKNLRKIMTNSLLLNSVKLKGINKIKNLSTSQINLNNFNDDKNNKNDNNNNKSNQCYKKITIKNKNDLKERNASTHTNFLNEDIKNDFKGINKRMDKKEDDKKNYNNTQDIDNYISTSFKNNNINNISFNFSKNNMNNKNEDMNDIKESLHENIQKLKEEAIKIKKKKTYTNIINYNIEEEIKFHENENIDEDENNKELIENQKIVKEKEKMEKKKLAKLSKLFNNLNKENNIINAIKEQFLDWTSKNDFPIRNRLNKDNNNNNKNNENDDNKIVKTYRQYEVKTFDIKNIFNKDNTNLDENIEKDNKESYKEFKRKLHVLRNKLIIFFLKNKKEVSENEDDEKNEKQSKYERYENEKDKEEENLVNEKEKEEKIY